MTCESQNLSQLAYDKMEEEVHDDAETEKVADQMYDGLNNFKKTIARNVRKELKKQMDEENIAPEEKMAPEEMLAMMGEAGMVIEELERQQRNIVRFKVKQ